VIVSEGSVYLESIALVRTLPCLAEPGKIIVVGKPSRDLGDVLPFLATLPNTITYNPDAHTLTFRRARGFLTLYCDKVIFTQLDHPEQGLELLAALVDAINATWTHRHELIAITKPQRAPRPLDVWALLPQSNCKQCGEMTCMAFAFAVLQQQRELAECKPLAGDAALADRRVTLEALLGIGS
jgi:ArsR family metal-binding transcriptional regulator